MPEFGHQSLPLLVHLRESAPVNCHEGAPSLVGISDGLRAAVFVGVPRPDLRVLRLCEVVNPPKRSFGHEETGIEEKLAQFPVKKH